MQQDGVFVLNKPKGVTSNACLQRIKYKLGQKKIGHAGTLDPMVDGVLLVLLGQATKISSYLMECGSKIYKGQLCLGVETTTWDREGEILREVAIDNVSERMVFDAILSWKGVQQQEVPPISAAKFKGKSLYKWVRMGYDVPRKFKDVCIEYVEVLSIEFPYATFRVQCSSGTYIRSLVYELGKRLGCGATLYDLTREYSYPFSLEKSIVLDDILSEESLFFDNIQSIESSLPHFGCIIVNESEFNDLRCGKTILARSVDSSSFLRSVAIYNGKACALLVLDRERGVWRILRGFF